MLSLWHLSFFLSSACALALPSTSPHEEIERLPLGWSNVGNAPRDALLTLRAYLSHDQGGIVRVANDVSDPSSPRFRDYLDADELASVLPDARNASSSVVQWLQLHGVSNYWVHDSFVEYHTTVGNAEKMLRAKFDAFAETKQTAQPILRTQSYSLPNEVRSHIDFIYPTIHFFSTGKRDIVRGLDRRQHIPTGPATCSNSVCPPELRSKYSITYRPEDNKSGSKIGIAGFLNNFPNITDVKSFLAQYGGSKDAKFPHYESISVRNGTTQIPSGSSALTVEAELDLDYSIAFTGPLDASFYSVGGTGMKLSQPGNKPVSPSDNEPYLEFLQYILSLKSPPQVLSISYSDDEQSIPVAYAKRVCGLFAQAAARGISVVVASGDGGASGSGGDTNCIGPNGKKRFIPTFPSSCPWVTSVGATASYGGAASFSSGGFSNYFPRPSWQESNATAYIKALNGSHSGFYNKTGRAIPDVSLIGDDYLTLGAGYPSNHDGTSASAPVFAAMIALINDIRLRAKKPALGFLNPLLYTAKAQSVYNDVADSSESVGCADGNSFESGWQALKGWDAATGLGEPNFEKLRELLQ